MHFYLKHQAFAICILAFGLGSSAALAQDAPAPVMVGGYSETSIKDQDVRIAALFAVKAHALEKKKPHKLKAILKAQHQVVAGKNYKLCLNVAEGKHFKHAHLIEAVVYKDLQQKLSLTSWSHVKSCG